MKEAVERQRKSLKKRQSGKLLFLQMFNLEFIYWLFGLYDCLRLVGFSIILWPLSSWSISDSRIQRLNSILRFVMWDCVCVCCGEVGHACMCAHGQLYPYFMQCCLDVHFRCWDFEVQILSSIVFSREIISMLVAAQIQPVYLAFLSFVRFFIQHWLDVHLMCWLISSSFQVI